MLQSVEDASVSFIVLPYNPALVAITPEDIAETLGALGIAEGDGAVLLIVSVRRAGERPACRSICARPSWST